MSRAAVRVLSGRGFALTPLALSHIGKAPIRLLEGVKCHTQDIPAEFCKSFTKGKTTYQLNRHIVVQGPLGQLKVAVPEFVLVKTESDAVSVLVANSRAPVQRQMWGTTRALLQNNVIGTYEGHMAIVKLVGTGYRASVEDLPEGQVVSLKIGLPYTPKLQVPEGVKASLPNPARLVLEGINKQQVKLFAARIRSFRKPEPYKGKGIFVDGETIRLKQKKIK